MNFKTFLAVNRLKSTDVADYLGVSRTSVSKWCSETANPKDCFVTKLLDNPYGWDVSMLADEKPMVQTHATGASKVRVAINSHNKVECSQSEEALLEKIADLERQLEEEKVRSAQYWEMIQNLIKK